MFVIRACRPWLWAICAALCLPPTLLAAQPVYRCANTYSDRPCPGGATIDVDDSRSTAQKAQTDAATLQAMRQAAQMETTRLEGERPTAATPGRPGTPAANRAARAIKTNNTNINKPYPPNGRKKAAPRNSKAGKTARKKTDEPVYFTATTRQDGN